MYKLAIFIVLFAALPQVLYAHSHSKHDTVAYMSEQLSIEGRVKKKLTLDVASLAKHPKQNAQEIAIQTIERVERHQIARYQGVLLTDLLSEAGINDYHRNELKKTAIIAQAVDGYKVVFSWTELFNSDIGRGVVVVYQKNGQALDQSLGKIALISAQDTATGPRFVKWLDKISVVKIAD